MPLVAKPLENATFLCADEHACRVLVRERGEVIDWHGQALDPELAASLEPGPIASAPFLTEHLSGRIFFVGLDKVGPQIIPAVDVAAREIGHSLDQLFLSDRNRELAVQIACACRVICMTACCKV